MQNVPFDFYIVLIVHERLQNRKETVSVFNFQQKKQLNFILVYTVPLITPFASSGK